MYEEGSESGVVSTKERATDRHCALDETLIVKGEVEQPGGYMKVRLLNHGGEVLSRSIPVEMLVDCQ